MGDSYESSGSEESIADDDVRDPDYFQHSIQSYDSSESDEIDFACFDKWESVSLEPIAKRRTKSELWNYFGCLKKNDKIFIPTSKKYFCRPCFDDHKFRWWVVLHIGYNLSSSM